MMLWSNQKVDENSISDSEYIEEEGESSNSEEEESGSHISLFGNSDEENFTNDEDYEDLGGGAEAEGQKNTREGEFGDDPQIHCLL